MRWVIVGIFSVLALSAMLSGKWEVAVLVANIAFLNAHVAYLESNR